MDLNSLCKKMANNLNIFRNVEFTEIGITVRLEPPTSDEEIKILSDCMDLEGHEYINGVKVCSLASSIKAINDITLDDNTEYEYTDDNGEKSKLSKYLYLKKMVGGWLPPIRDTLFEAFTNMQEEVDDKVKSMAKFKRFVVTKPEQNVKSTFKRIENTEEEGDLTETEKLNKMVEKEQEQAEIDLNK